MHTSVEVFWFSTNGALRILIRNDETFATLEMTRRKRCVCVGGL